MEQIVTRHRHEIRRRNLTVREKFHLTPAMVRIVLEGEDMADFPSLAPDDHVKLFLPGEGDEPVRRDYTPRSFDIATRQLTIDFAVHDAGPATAWAVAARPGDTLQLAGPRGSAVVSAEFDWYLLIGDETALPAIGRWIEEMPAGRPVVSIATVVSGDEEQSFATRADHHAIWLHRPLQAAGDASSILAALAELRLPEGRGFIWIAAEARVARVVRDHVTGPMGHPLHWTKASGYWVEGEAEGTDKQIID